MPRIRLTRSGLNIEGAVRVRGEVVDVPADVADYLVPSGQAELVRDASVEVAVSGPPETATSRRRRTTNRGSRPNASDDH